MYEISKNKKNALSEMRKTHRSYGETVQEEGQGKSPSKLPSTEKIQKETAGIWFIPETKPERRRQAHQEA